MSCPFIVLPLHICFPKPIVPPGIPSAGAGLVSHTFLQTLIGRVDASAILITSFLDAGNCVSFLNRPYSL
jgi:hypothetical protein